MLHVKLTQRGFTLIEMLIVIVIIGILAAALIPQLSGVQGRSRDIARQADLRNIAGAFSIYQVDNAAFPSGAEAGSGGFKALSGLLTIFESEGYLINIPRDPQGDQYAYQTNNVHTVFAISSRSESAKKNANWHGTALEATTTVSVMSGDEALASEIKLCDGVIKRAADNVTPGGTNCEAKFPMYVFVE